MNWSRMLLCASALGCLPFAGCDDATSASVRSDSHLIVINQTDYEWRVAVATANGANVASRQVAARATLPFDLPGGDYVIEQVLLSTAADADLTRKIPFQLKAGKTYRWQLATLWSDSDSPAGAESTKP